MLNWIKPIHQQSKPTPPIQPTAKAKCKASIRRSSHVTMNPEGLMRRGKAIDEIKSQKQYISKQSEQWTRHNNLNLVMIRNPANLTLHPLHLRSSPSSILSFIPSFLHSLVHSFNSFSSCVYCSSMRVFSGFFSCILGTVILITPSSYFAESLCNWASSGRVNDLSTWPKVDSI